MPPVVSVPPELTRGPFTRATALSYITAEQLRHPVYRLVSRGIYIVGAPRDHGDMITAARLVLPDTAVLGGRSALWAMGVQVVDVADRVEVFLTAKGSVRRRDLLRVRHDVLEEEHVMMTPFGLASEPARTAFDLTRLDDPLVSVPLLDALVRGVRVHRRRIEAIAAAKPGARWLSRVAPTLDLVDPGAESLPESRLRVTLVLAGLPKPQTQVKVFNAAGEFIARVDLAWPWLKIAVEYDGIHHDDPTQLARDRARINALRAAGWTVIVIDRQQFRRPADVVDLVRRVIEAAG
ncbi:endonuclease domain-containing protein [Georgenia yuyongxinii]